MSEKILTAKELIDIIQPKHDRTSCSDDNINNGFYSSETHTRCARCTLLEILENDDLPSTHEIIILCNITKTNLGEIDE